MLLPLTRTSSRSRKALSASSSASERCWRAASLAVGGWPRISASMANCLNRAAASEFDWTSAAKDALLCASAGGFGYPPAGLGLAPRFAGLWVVRASIPTLRTNGVQTHVVPFHREVP